MNPLTLNITKAQIEKLYTLFDSPDRITSIRVSSSILYVYKASGKVAGIYRNGYMVDLVLKAEI